MHACKIQFFFFLFTPPLAVGFPHHRRQHHPSTAHRPRSDPWLSFFKSTSNCWGNLLALLAPIQRILAIFFAVSPLNYCESLELCANRNQSDWFLTQWVIQNSVTILSILEEIMSLGYPPCDSNCSLLFPLWSPQVYPLANSSLALFLRNCSSVCLPYTGEFWSDPFNEVHFPKVFIANPHIFFKSFSRFFSS